MKNFQYLLLKLAEEAAEVAQIALKTAQFGYNEYEPGINENNLECIHKELDDMMGVIGLLNTETQFNYTSDPSNILCKMEKVIKYRMVSQSYGLVRK